ncbi:hypothetical protein PHYSODRAFT_336038 [Phytophthora sojae]|uniref:Retrotransposon gag domain-containing protein n=1 Tax=Phytophthora sojae (strain P6497) TaxID=1094619 RepID=G4ZVQ0_PHYSP|nr:hypothetical protein PHYSODRAFT_336038 [Phytophthora sojae]EGZ11514.1 hypothetical protein PHYSODRAFT_336038 [Phytophthora sojae]|eukprot:XP_009531847.1 hypothetical protein PHYSODRAFT_336038 [Phytophthora sojae]
MELGTPFNSTGIIKNRGYIYVDEIDILTIVGCESEARNTARRVLRFDTAPARRLLELEDGPREESASGATNRSRTTATQRIDQLETGLTDLRQEFAVAHDSLRVEVTAELTNLNSSIGAEMTEIKGHLSNLVQALHNPQAVSAQVQRAETPAIADVNMMTPAEAGRTFASTRGDGRPPLRKMDVSPPTFDGLIDGIKLNSFLFQFESYFQQKGYRLDRDDHWLPGELNQCVRKNAAVWYERYMTDDTTIKLWSVMKVAMIRGFREPNFQAKVRNQLLQLKQTGAYHGYVNKFRELQRVVGLDELTAINVFPITLTAAVQEGFLECELQEKPATTSQRGNDHVGFGKKQQGVKQKRNNEKTDQRGVKRLDFKCVMAAMDLDHQLSDTSRAMKEAEPEVWAELRSDSGLE